ncbi:MAG: hypothetical protein WCN98_21130 [Verrucomicrobiaceae bacterium]
MLNNTHRLFASMAASLLRIIALALFFASALYAADGPDVSKLGREVLAVKKAIANPADPNSMNAIKELGLQTAYYTMVRGWLLQELSGSESIKSAQNPNTATPELDTKIAFLKKAIRAIDLE